MSSVLSLLRATSQVYRSIAARTTLGFSRLQVQDCTYSMSSCEGSPFTDDVIKYLDDVHHVIVSEALVKGTDRKTKVIEFKQPEELEKILDLPVNKEGVSHEKLLDICRNTIKHSVQTAHPRFMNQLYSGRDPYTLTATWLAEALNTNQHTYEVAPVFILVEKYMAEKVSKVVGFPKGDGVFVAGGNMGNMCAMHLARYRYNNNIKNTGLPASKPMVLYASQEAHYSINTGASFLGFGLDNVERIEVDARGRMVPEHLEATIKRNKEEGKVPLFVMATCGTTVLGAYDPLNPIADICERHNLWFHVDGAWGGSVLLSDKHRKIMDGVERADSYLWNFHKMVAVQLQNSLFVTKHQGLLRECNSSHADYLYQTDKLYDVSWDRGDLAIQCGRKADAFKLWLMWKAQGDLGMAAIVDSHFEKAAYFTNKLRETEGFRLVMPEFECLNICFWYIPPRLRGKPETPEWWQEVSKVAPAIKAGMQEKGSLMIGFCPIVSFGFVNFWRIIITNRQTTTADLDFVIEEIDRLGKDL